MTVRHALALGLRISRVGSVWLLTRNGQPVTACPTAERIAAAAYLWGLALDCLSPSTRLEIVP